MEEYSGILSEEEINSIKKIYDKQKDIMSYLNMEDFIIEVKSIILESENFSFRNQSAFNNIDKRKPIFRIKLDNTNLIKGMNEEQARETITNMVNKEIISEISNSLLDAFKGVDGKKLFDGIPEDIIKNLLVNIYVIRIGVNENNIQISYFI